VSGTAAQRAPTLQLRWADKPRFCNKIDINDRRAIKISKNGTGKINDGTFAGSVSKNRSNNPARLTPLMNKVFFILLNILHAKEKYCRLHPAVFSYFLEAAGSKCAHNI
jgi:hypothetical protein